MSLQISTERKAKDAFIVSPSGSLNNVTSKQFENELDSIIDASTKLIVFDLENLEYLSSAGIRVFVKASKALKSSGGKATFINLQPSIRKVFEIINALPSMKVFRDIDELDAYLDTMQKRYRE